MNAMVVGSAATLQDDIAAARAPFVVIAVNDAGWLCQLQLDHWCHLHTEDMPGRIDKRRVSGGNMNFVTWSRRDGKGGETPDRYAPQHFGPGSSGLYAVGVALKELGCKKVVLCGVPMDPTPRFGDDVPWDERDPAQGVNKLDLFRPYWERADLRQVRSCSGWTREILGAPTHEWLAAVRDPRQPHR
jgi:hypothetical protein